MDKLTFYTNPMSRGQIIRWMIQELGVEHTTVLIEYGSDMKSDNYLAVNPMGKVPAIKHADKVVTECAAICAYLADAYPEKKLAPALEHRADYYRWLFFAAGPLESAVLNKGLGFEVDDDQQRTAGYGNYDLTISTLDQLLGEQDYVCGDVFSAADVYLGSQVDWGVMFKTIPETENFMNYVERLRARPAYQQAKAIDAALMPQILSDQS